MTYNEFLATQRADWEAAILRATKTFPPNSATNYSPTLDLWAAKHPQDGSEKFSVRVTLPASASLANAQTITATIQTSSDGTNFSDTNLITTLTGAGGIGSAGQTVVQALPKPYLQYVRSKMVATSGNDPSFDGMVILDLLFA